MADDTIKPGATPQPRKAAAKPRTTTTKKPVAKKAPVKKAPAKKAPAKTGASKSANGAATPKRKTATPAKAKTATASVKRFPPEASNDSTGFGKAASAKAYDYAKEIKTRASEAISGLGRMIGDSAEVIDDNIGPRYGDYARDAARSVGSAADSIRAKDIDELTEDVRQFVRKSPALAIGLATVASLVTVKLISSAFSRDD